MSRNILPHTIVVHREKQRAAELWCQENLGPKRDFLRRHDEGLWTCFWCGPKRFSEYVFHFKNEENALLFALKWAV